jgi:hypothetical protein
MNVYWCAEHMSFHSNLEKAFLYTSILTWKHFYPNDITNLYCDTESKQIIEEIGIINLWDNVNTEVLDKKQYDFDQNAFWASSKLKVINEIKAPFVIIDLDLFIKNKFIPDEYWQNDVVGNFMEITTNHYPEPRKIKKYMDLPDFDWDDNAVNVAFLYINNEQLRTEYAQTALDWMSVMTKDGGQINGLNMVFCEQKLLWQLIKRQNLNHRFLFNQTLICHKDEWIDNNLGIFPKIEEYKYATHFGPDKRRAFDESNGYYIECKQNVLETFYKLFPHLSQNILNLLNTGHV